MSAPEQPAPIVAPTPPQAKAQPAAHAATPSPSAATPPASGATPRQVDVAVVLDTQAKGTGEKLDWRTSIVDLMKLLKLDSSLTARKTLAKELNYTGDTKDTAAMNVWLHKQVMARLEQGGGKLPADVKH
jgi:hypothetical protein